MKYKILFFFVIFLFCHFVAFADVPNQGALDQILNIYVNSAATWESLLQRYAERLFWILVLIDLVLLAINLSMNPGEFSSFTANLVRKVLVIGFFYALIQPASPIYGPKIAKVIVSSFQVAANSLNTSLVATPSGIFGMGFNLMVKIFDKISFLHPGDSLGYIIAGYIIMIVFALIAAMLLLVTVQMYITIYAGVILLGFGGSSYTRDIAIMYLKSALSTGTKLFIMLLITTLAVDIINNWITAFSDVTFKQLGLFIGVSVVLLALTKVIPDMVASMINGMSYGSGSELMHTTTRVGKSAVATTAGAVAGAAGGYMAVSEAAKLATTQGAKGVVGKTTATAKNLVAGGADYAKGRLSGETSPHFGTTGGKIASKIAQKHGLTPKETATKPKDEPSP